MGYQCFHCLTDGVYWQSDFSFEDYGIEGEGIIHVCKCANCGADIEYYVPIEVEGEEEDGKVADSKGSECDPGKTG